MSAQRPRVCLYRINVLRRGAYRTQVVSTIGAVFLLCLTVFLSSCALGNAGLSTNLQPAGTSGGSFQILSRAAVDGIINRTYKKRILTSLSSGFVGAPSATGGTAPITCSLIAGALPTGLTLAADSGTPTAGTDCFVEGTPTQTGAFSFTVQAVDGNFPPSIAVQSLSMTVRPDFTITGPSSLPAAAQGRSYGMAPQIAPLLTTNLSSTAPLPITAAGTVPIGNGPIAAGGCAVSGTSNPGITSAPDSTDTQCQVQSTMLSTSGVFSVALTVTDNPILDPETCETAAPTVCDVAVPARTAAASANQFVVNAPITLAETSGAPAVAVNGRSFGVGSNCAGGACKPVTYSIAGGLGGYTVASTAGPLACAFTSTGTFSGTYTCSSGSVAGSTGLLNLTVADTGNSASPSQSTTDASQTLTVDPAMVLSPVGTPPAAVVGRPYGTGTGCSGGGACQPFSYSISGGLGGYTAGPIAVNPLTCSLASGGTLSGTYNCTSASIVNCACSSLSLSVSDTANASTPAQTLTDASRSLVVDAAMTFSEASGTPAPAESGFAYGTGTGCTGAGGNCAPVTYAVAGGLGGYTANPAAGPLTCTLSGGTYNCSSNSVAGTSPATLSISVSDSANSATPNRTMSDSSQTLTIDSAMMLTATSGAPATAVLGSTYGQGIGCSGGACAPVTYSITGGLGGYTASPTAGPLSCTLSGSTYTCSSASIAGSTGPLSLSVSAAGNASTPTHTVTNSSLSLTINPALSLTETSGPVAPAVNGRAYGQGTGCSGSGGTCQAVTYAVAGGLGGYSAGPITLGPLTCTFTSGGVLTGTYSCSSANVSGSTGTLSLLVSDTANASTPSHTKTDATQTLTVNSALALNETSGTPPVGVIGRAYGTGIGCSGGACLPVAYSISGGLGGYTSSASAGPLTCSLFGTTYNCTSGSLAGSNGANPLSLTVSDTANVATPSSSVSNNSQSLTLNPAMALSETSGVPAAAVTGRSYGQGSKCGAAGTSACAAVTYSITGGLGGYPSSTPDGPLTCTFAGVSLSGSYTCTSASISGSSGTLSFSVSDIANSSSPSQTLTDTSQILTVNAALALGLGVTPDPASNPAVVGRSYGVSPQSPPVYTATGGLPAYNFTLPSTNPTVNGLDCTAAATAVTCSSNSITGPTGTSPSFTVSVTDTANASTPAVAAPVSVAKTLTVNSALAIATPSLPNALLDYPYQQTISATGGLGSYTWVAPGVSNSLCSPTGTLPSPLIISPVSGSSTVLSGTPDTATTPTTLSSAAFQVCVTDTANQTTPAGSALPNIPASTPANSFTVDVLNQLSVVAETGGAVQFADTRLNEIVDTFTAPSGQLPDSVVISPNGRTAYVSDSQSNGYWVFDTITFAETHHSVPSGCTGPAGLALTPDGTSLYIACFSSDSFAVVDTATNSGTNFGLASGSVPIAAAATPDGNSICMTLTGTNALAIISTQSSHTVQTVNFNAPSGSMLMPMGIAIPSSVAGTSDLYAYVADQDQAMMADSVGVVDVTAGNLSTTVQLAAGSTPSGVAVTPDNADVYVTLFGTNAVDVVSNSQRPSIVAGPISLTATTTNNPISVAIPPLAAAPFDVYVVMGGAPNGQLAVIKSSTNAFTGTSIPLSSIGGDISPSAIANIPVPK